jgi:hypothetical protein
MTLYVRKIDLFSAKEIHQEEKIATNIGEITVFKDDVVLRNMHGHTLIINKKGLEDIYTPVEKVKKSSLFAEAYAQAAGEFSLESGFEDSDYISKTKSMHNIENN